MERSQAHGLNHLLGGAVLAIVIVASISCLGRKWQPKIATADEAGAGLAIWSCAVALCGKH